MASQVRAQGRDVDTRIAGLLLLVAGTLVVMAVLHLTDTLAGGEPPFRGDHAGIAELIICVVLIGGAAALLRAIDHAHELALFATGFGIVGFIVGLTFTVRGSGVIDIGYHVLFLPVLVYCAVVLVSRLREVHRELPPPQTAPRVPTRAK